MEKVNEASSSSLRGRDPVWLQFPLSRAGSFGPQPDQRRAQASRCGAGQGRPCAIARRAGQFTVANASGLSPLSKVQMGDTAIDYTKANPTPYSGYCRSSILEALRDDAYLSIVSDLPLPLSVTGIVPDVEDVEST